MTVFGQTLSGNFAFEQTAGDLVIAASEVELHLGDGTTDFVTLTKGKGAFVVLPTVACRRRHDRLRRPGRRRHAEPHDG